MNEGDSTSTLEEAFACVRRHFMEPDGLLGKIEQGESINETEVQQIAAAFEVMQDAWEEKTLVPKEAVRLILHVSNSLARLDQCMRRFPQQKDAIVSLVSKVTHWREHVFSYPLVNEEAALVMVGQHLLGTRPFNIELIMGDINEDSLGELLEALDILGQVWESREQISKFAASTLVDAPWLFDRVVNHFPRGKLQRLHETREQVMDSITRCLS